MLTYYPVIGSKLESFMQILRRSIYSSYFLVKYQISHWISDALFEHLLSTELITHNTYLLLRHGYFLQTLSTLVRQKGQNWNVLKATTKEEPTDNNVYQSASEHRKKYTTRVFKVFLGGCPLRFFDIMLEVQTCSFLQIL